MPMPPRYRTTMNLSRIIDFSSAGNQFSGVMDLHLNYPIRPFNVTALDTVFKQYNQPAWCNQATESSYSTILSTAAQLAGFAQIMPLPSIANGVLPWYNNVRVLKSTISIDIVNCGAYVGETPSTEVDGLFIATQPYLVMNQVGTGPSGGSYDLNAINTMDDARQDPLARMTSSGSSKSSKLNVHRNSVSMKRLLGVKSSAVKNDISGSTYTSIGLDSGSNTFVYTAPREYIANWRVLWAAGYPDNASSAYIAMTLAFHLTYELEFFNTTTNLLSRGL